MILHPAAVLRRSAQSIRHAPGLRRFGALWERLRVPYRLILTRLAGQHGLPVTIGGQTMRLAPDVVNLNWETVEVESYRAFAEAIAPGDVISDVGAHFGTYTLIGVAHGGPAARVIAYEPGNLTRQYLMRHLRWNGAERQVLVRPVCCGSRVGTAVFYHRPDRPEGINGLLPHDGLSETTVRMTTIDREADLAVRGLVARGHEVTLFAHPESRAGVPLVPYGVPPHTGAWTRVKELWQLGSALAARRRQFDVVFSWGRLAALLPILPDRRLPKIQRYCRNIVPWRGVRMAVQLAGDSISFAGASASVYDELPHYGESGGRWHTLYDAIDISKYTFVRDAAVDAPPVFLGRLERLKGAHAAIAIAKGSGRRLILAGKHATSGPESTYFIHEIAPQVDCNRC